MAPIKKPLHIRFWAKVNKTNSCWLWTSVKQGRGYGFFTPSTVEGRKTKPGIMAHRMAWILKNGNIPSGKLVCHKCDNKLCVRPSHLFLGTQKQNTQDMIRKNRQRGGLNQPFNHVGVKKNGNLSYLRKAKT